MAGERPVGVTIVAVIAWIIGAIQIVGAILALIAGAGFDAWVVLIIGILTIAVSLGLFRGSNAARIIMAIVFTLNLVVAVWAIVIGVDFWDQVDRGRAGHRRARVPVLHEGERLLPVDRRPHETPTPSGGRGSCFPPLRKHALVVRSQRFHKNGHRKAGR